MLNKSTLAEVCQPVRRLFVQKILCCAGAHLAAGIALPVWAQSPNRAVPGELAAFTQSASPWGLLGSGTLRYFGFKAYEAYLWVPGGAANPIASKSQFALEIEYSTAIKGEEIANVSMIEMARLRSPSETQIKAWAAELKKTFSDVKAGDKLTGVYLPKVGARFFFNSRLISEVNDIAFSDAFFAIWLDEKTKRGDLRRALLGLAPVSNSPAYTN
jgi:Chalcone isomerase-like